MDKQEYCRCSEEFQEMEFKGEVSAWQIWQCPQCKEIRVTNY